MIVILTALQREYKTFRKHLTDLQTHRHPAGTRFEVGALADKPDRHVALALTGAGNAPAAAITERAITKFQPTAVMFVGIAGGLRDWVELGDVVVATRVYGYHGGYSEDKAFRARPQAWETSHDLIQVAQHVDRADTWRSKISDNPAVHFSPIAAGEVLLDSTNSVVAKQLRDHYNDAIAIEMESAGMAQASHLNLSTPTITIRGISDHANGAKDFTDRSGAPQLAAENAAAFAAAFVAELDEASTQPDQRGKNKQNHQSINNIATGNASVVAQIGVVNGAVQFSSAKPGEGGS